MNWESPLGSLYAECIGCFVAVSGDYLRSMQLTDMGMGIVFSGSFGCMAGTADDEVVRIAMLLYCCS